MGISHPLLATQQFNRQRNSKAHEQNNPINLDTFTPTLRHPHAQIFAPQPNAVRLRTFSPSQASPYFFFFLNLVFSPTFRRRPNMSRPLLTTFNTHRGVGVVNKGEEGLPHLLGGGFPLRFAVMN